MGRPYHRYSRSTALWRISREIAAREGRDSNTVNSDENLSDSEDLVTIDRFYRERLEARETGGYYRPRRAEGFHIAFEQLNLEWGHGPHRTHDGLTYAAEKLLFYEFVSQREGGEAKDVCIHTHLLENSVSAEASLANEGRPAPSLSLCLDFFLNDKVRTELELSVYGGCVEDHHVPEVWRRRCDATQKRLEYLLEKYDEAAFEEALADFWDTLFPETAGVGFFDGATPVPRLGKMAEFLTRPCPKGFGVMQCEIQRTRYAPDGKMSVKERFFPTYEYRLFIRNQHDNNASDSQQAQCVSETILMTARTISRHKSKRGVNNYGIFLHLDGGGQNQEEEVDLGRLQSNFVGTEFQIFAKTDIHIQEECKPAGPILSQCSHVVAPSVPSQPGHVSPNPKAQARYDDDSDCDGWDARNRSLSWSHPITSTKQTFPNNLGMVSRRVTPNPNPALSHSALPTEFEDGAITYTANLLGNRPRIMDVCIPRILDGRSSPQWRPGTNTTEELRPPNTCTGLTESCKMLSKFKRLLYALNEAEAARNHDLDPLPDDIENWGLLALQNRQPWWNFELGAFVLNFGGRVSVASVKNFQLCERTQQDHVMLQFGRIRGRHAFTMDFQYPLTAFQAFAIAISSLQSKIAIA
mmetsp:Transcript_9722/g.21654  ORF Transcript_9722/g.21654 Transcript_9722/m.21654 type:complete len:638 (+) Transcript_9722:1618-3531(+)